MAKRAAPSTSSAPSSKKAKPASTSKSTPKGKKAVAATTTTDSPLDAVKQVASDIINSVSEVVDNAGDLLMDDGNTPAPVSKVIEENVDVPLIKRKGKAAKGKAIEVAKDAEEAVENAIEEKTGLDVKEVKGKTNKAIKSTKKQVDNATETATETAKPLKGKAAKAASAAQDAVEKAANDPKNRKKAEDFMTSAEETVKAVAGKVGEVLNSVVDKFGEASGLTTADVNDQVEKGKKVAQKKGKQVKEAAEETIEEGKKVAGKKGQQVKKAAEDTVEEGKKAVAKKGQQAKKAAEDVVEEGKKTAGKKGKQAEQVVEEGKKVAGKKGKQATEAAAETVEQGKKVAGKKGKGEAAEEVKETTKRKAKNATDAIEPSTKKAKAAAEPVVAKGKKAVADATKSAEPIISKGKKAASAAAGKATKAVADVVQPEEEDEEYIHGFSSSDGEADSSDDESDDEDRAVAEAGRKVDMTSLPMVAKDDKSVQAKLKKASKKKDDPKGTLFLGRIPHGFYEEQMKEYFSQFGDVTRLRLARNRKTGASKHYAYLEFSSQSVAVIVAETMNNYLLMGHILKCQVIPAEKVHPDLWVGANKKFRKIPTARVEKQKHEKDRNEEEQSKADKKLLKKEGSRKRKIKDAGIDYQFEGHVSCRHRHNVMT
ncbi:uncharacterized protein IL334_002863 [Kwoniella shivajii]|uniref:RRM domain-containing protein n=1 Tax=Kwoniella shivajii TaxID=564305 RepID=A0ABZ1CX27_9TREE|nr:hypothetical protein IL334_002863 [Kwoniella shivajii]